MMSQWIGHRKTGMRVAATFLILATFLMAAGCATPKVTIWMPAPITMWSEITPDPPGPIANSYRILRQQPTEGLFPAAMAVTRVGSGATLDNPDEQQLHLLRDPRNELLGWNSAFDDQMAISEVFPIAKRDLGGASVEPQRILQAMSALHAKVGFVYAFNSLSDSEAEMIGVLYQTEPMEPLAVVHAHETSLPAPEESKEPLDLWKYDADARVRRKFAKLVHTCVRELVRRDKPQREDPPAGWIPQYPVLPVEWPPYSGQSR